jgi:phosphodiesterase/alkaline phosphatase D-like protein
VTELVLGPLLRYVDDTSATVWVETDGACTVEVLGHAARTFQVGGHHFALVAIRGLTPGSSTPYEVRLDGTVVWSTQRGSRIRTVPAGPDSALRLLFGSCRFGPTEDPKHDAALGPDALAASAHLLTTIPLDEWPHAILLLGDQVYADQTTPQVQREFAARRDLRRPPGVEVSDFEEYTVLYRHSWGSRNIRWLLSTVPSMMIFDDHDVRDDWNTSARWRARMSRERWWRERLLGGLVSYWVYQHLGNLSPDELDEDETYRRVRETSETGDAMPVLRQFAERCDMESHGTKGFRWSYRRDLGPARLVVVDTRAGRILDTAPRAMLSEQDFEWLHESTGGNHDHVVLASSLPWLLPHAVHHLQSWNEAACERDDWRAEIAERVRQVGDLEHWAAFRRSFERLSDIIAERARSSDGYSAPATISVLSGDVHHSYLADAHYPTGTTSRVVQVTCSPLHNAAPAPFRGPLKLAWHAAAARSVRYAAARAGVPAPPVAWTKTEGPYFGNAVGMLVLTCRDAEVTLLQAEDTATLKPVCRRALT